jgi:hypothetical protein
VRASGGSALAATLAHVEATFAAPMRHAVFKDRVASLMACGAGHAEVWTRYRELAERHPVATLGGAIALVERLRVAEIEARQSAIRAWGHCSHPRIALMLLDELRLILRMVRRRAPSCYAELLAAVRAGEPSSKGSWVDSGTPGSFQSRTNCQP